MRTDVDETDETTNDIGLVYAAGTDEDDEPILWIGRSPTDFRGAEPTHFGTVPAPAQLFLRNVHAGFTSEDLQSHGLMAPAGMKTLAESVGPPLRESGWEVGYGEDKIHSSRLLWLTRDYGELLYCTSPDLPPGTLTLVYDGDVDPPKDFWQSLDALLGERWDE